MPAIPKGPAIKPITPKALRYLSFSFQCLNSMKSSKRQNRNRSQGLWYWKAEKAKKPLKPKKPGKPAKTRLVVWCLPKYLAILWSGFVWLHF